MTKPHAEQWSEAVAFKVIRKRLNLKQNEMARRLGITPPHISLIETGRRSPSAIIVKLVSHEFQVDPAWLKTGKGSMRLGSETNPGVAVEATAPASSPPDPEAINESLLPGMIGALANSAGLDAARVVERIKDILNIGSDRGLARRFEINPSTITNWRRTNRIPSVYLLKVLKSGDISLDQLFVGLNGEPMIQIKLLTGVSSEQSALLPDQQLLKSIRLFLQNAKTQERRKFITDVALLLAGENLDDKVKKGK